MGHETNTLGHRRLPSVVLTMVLLSWATPAEANLFRGLQELVGGVLQVPVSTLAGTFRGPPVVGTVLGALNGVLNGVTLVARGVFDVAASVVPVAKAVVPFLIPVFL